MVFKNDQLIRTIYDKLVINTNFFDDMVMSLD